MRGEAQQGILPDAAIRQLIADGAIALAAAAGGHPGAAGEPRPPARPEGNARARELPARPGFFRQRRSSASSALHEFDLAERRGAGDGLRLYRAAARSLALPADIAASANPKSSTGRLDVFTRVITDEARAFDKMPEGYSGPLYLEVSPRTFPILVRTGSRLSQIRFRRGNALLDDAALTQAPRGGDARDRRAALRRRAGALDRPRRRRIRRSGGLVGYRAKRYTGVIDVDKRRRLRRRRFLGADPPRASARRSCSTRRSSISSSPPRRCMCRRSMPPRWCPSIRWSASSACTMPASSIRASGTRRRAARQPRGARSPKPRGALHPGARADDRPARL